MVAPHLLPKISVVIPSYQQGQYIERTLQSLISQNYPDLEIIVIDGGSTDETVGIVKRYLPHISLFVSEKDHGQGDAIAKGFRASSGEIIAWMNSDDTYAVGALRTVGQTFAANPEVRFIYGNRDLIDEHDTKLARRRQPDFNLGVMLYAHMIVPQVAAFWRKSLFDEAGGLDTSLRFCMDFDLFYRMAKISAPIHLPEVLGNFRLHNDSKTSTLEDVRQSEDRVLQTRYCRFPPGSLRFFVLRQYYRLVLIGLLARNGGLWERLADRMSGTIRNNIRVSN